MREALELGRDIVFLDLGKAVLSTGTVKRQPKTGFVKNISVQSSPTCQTIMSHQIAVFLHHSPLHFCRHSPVPMISSVSMIV